MLRFVHVQGQTPADLAELLGSNLRNEASKSVACDLEDCIYGPLMRANQLKTSFHAELSADRVLGCAVGDRFCEQRSRYPLPIRRFHATRTSSVVTLVRFVVVLRRPGFVVVRRPGGKRASPEGNGQERASGEDRPARRDRGGPQIGAPVFLNVLDQICGLGRGTSGFNSNAGANQDHPQ